MAPERVLDKNVRADRRSASPPVSVPSSNSRGAKMTHVVSAVAAAGGFACQHTNKWCSGCGGSTVVIRHEHERQRRGAV